MVTIVENKVIKITLVLRIMFWDMTPCHWIIEVSVLTLKLEVPALLQKVRNQLHCDASHSRKMESSATLL
jgi:hypothetical protein